MEGIYASIKLSSIDKRDLLLEKLLLTSSLLDMSIPNKNIQWMNI
jgi:hypothetical protein